MLGPARTFGPLFEDGLKFQVSNSQGFYYELHGKAAGRRPKTTLGIGIRKAFIPAIRVADSLLAAAYVTS